jgi:hypothetical protein
MRIYKDALGHVYDVPEDRIEEFERRRDILLRIGIAGKLIVLACVLWFAWTH